MKYHFIISEFLVVVFYPVVYLLGVYLVVSERSAVCIALFVKVPAQLIEELVVLVLQLLIVFYSEPDMLDVNLKFPQLLNLIVQLIQSLVLDSLLVVEIFKSSWDKIIEDGLWLVDHVFVEMMLDVDLVKSHV